MSSPSGAKVAVILSALSLPFFVLAAAAWGALSANWLIGLSLAQFALLAVAVRVLRRALDARSDDAARAVHEMNERRARGVARMPDWADAIAASCGQILGGNDELSRRAQEQARGLAAMRSGIGFLTEGVARNAKQAREAQQLAEEAHSRAARGAEVASSTIGAMDEISSASGKIASIIGVIDEIAFQTNLLALNAAVEAARAGEQGRGFAVVAAEVRSLAGRSAVAAKQIKSLIQDSARYVREGEDLVERSGEALAELMDAVKRVKAMAGDIATASQEQSAGIERVSQAMRQVDAVTRHSAALLAESSEAARMLSERARELTT